MTDEEKDELQDILDELELRDQGNVLKYLFPEERHTLTPGVFPHGHFLFPDATVIHSRNAYVSAIDFWKAGKVHDQRLFMAGNRLGKTTAAGTEFVYHITGLYPKSWEGRVVERPGNYWAIGKSHETTRDVLQKLLLGPVGEWGTGLIPKECIDFESIVETKKAETAVKSFRVKHFNSEGIFDGWTLVGFKAYDQGRKAFEGPAVTIWIDEEPPQPVYGECLLRTATGDNFIMMTFTPMQGPTATIQQFFPEGDYKKVGNTGPGQWVTRASMTNAPHLNQKKVAEILASIPEYQREARMHGIPVLGAGVIFPFAPSSYTCAPFAIPKEWPKWYGFDVGRNTAAIWFTKNPDDRKVYAYSEMFMVEGSVGQHVESIISRGSWIKGAIDTAAHGRGQSDGENLFDIYTTRGLNIQNADKAVDAGIIDMTEGLLTGNLIIFSNLTGLLSEFSTYSRDELGHIMKKNDHRMDACRYGYRTRDAVMSTEPKHQDIDLSIYTPSGRFNI